MNLELKKEWIKQGMNKEKKAKKFDVLLIVILLAAVVVGVIVHHIWGSNTKAQSIQMKADATFHTVMEVDNLHNGDAKFFKEKIILTLDGAFTVYNTNGTMYAQYPEIEANWIDGLADENLVIYGNGFNQLGILRLNAGYHVVDNHFILDTTNLKIDPTITKIDGDYYITVTEIVGTTNNADPNVENGTYTIKMYKSSDLNNWELVSDVMTAQNNLEDVDVLYQNDTLYVIYEREVYDKANSGVYLIESKDKGATWSEEKELLPQDADHEPATFTRGADGTYTLVYSSDTEDLGASYMGGKVYFATYNEKFEVIEKDVLVHTEIPTGILLYDVVEEENGTQQLLFNRDYLTNCDLFIEES